MTIFLVGDGVHWATIDDVRGLTVILPAKNSQSVLENIDKITHPQDPLPLVSPSGNTRFR